MSDNTQIPDSDLIASDDIGGVKHQRVKLVLGADGVSDGDVSSANPMPVSGAFYQGTQPVSGAVALDAPTLAALETTSISGTVGVTGTFWQATQPISGTVTVANPTAQGLTDAQIRATALPVSGTVAVSNLPATQAVSGTFWQATQPVSGTVALDASSLAALETTSISGSVAVTGDFYPATQPISGSVSVSNFPAGGTGLTDTELRATPVPVSGSFYQTTQPVSAAALPLPAGAATDAVVQALTTLNDTMLYMLSAMLEKMPRVNGNDQCAVSIEAGNVGITGTPTVNVTTLSNITSIGGKQAAQMPDAISQMGALHLYQNITVS